MTSGDTNILDTRPVKAAHTGRPRWIRCFIQSPRSLVVGHLLLVIAIASTGCAFKSKSKSKKASEPQQAAHRLVGTIVAVNQQERFVLIDTESSPPADDGAALKSFSGDTQTAILTVSPERKPPFMIADIVSGAPQKGDQVFE